MLDSDLTIVILRNIQAELVSHRERFDTIDERFDRIDERLDTVANQMSHLDSRLINVENLCVKTANALGQEVQSSRHRSTSNEGEIAELKVRVAALETIVKGKPTL
jgi:predicted  nucleic acid-binding Zn-ribbon protein